MDTYSQEEIIKSENLFIYDLNLNHYDKFKDKFKTPETQIWAKVSSSDLGEHMIAMFPLQIFDYSISDYFSSYKSFVPIEKQDFYLKKFLTLEKDIDPAVVKSFFELLYPYLVDLYERKGYYYYSLLNLTNEHNNHSPIRIKINGVQTKFSTIHTTYTDEVENKDKIEIDSDNDGVKWEDIYDGKKFKGDTETIVVKKVKYTELVEKKFKNIYKMFDLAIDLNLKVNRNASW